MTWAGRLRAGLRVSWAAFCGPGRIRHPWSVSFSLLSSFPITPGIGKPKPDRKSTRLNSSHLGISYAVFCLKKKKRYPQYVTADIGERHTVQCRWTHRHQ